MISKIAILCAIATLTAFGHKHDHLKSRFGHLRARSNDSNSTDQNDRLLTWNENVRVQVLSDSQINLIAGYDVKNNISNVINGTTGVAYVIDLKTSTIYPLNNTKTTAEELSKSSLENQLKEAKKNPGTPVNTTDENAAGKETLELINSVLSGSNKDSSDKLKNPLDKINKHVELNNGCLRGFYNGTGSAKVKELKWMIGAEIAYSILIENVTDGLESLVKEGVKVDVKEIMETSTGTESVLVILKQIGANADLTKVLGTGLEVPSRILRAIAAFENPKGIDGLLAIVSHAVDIVHGQGSIENLIELILRIARSQTPINVDQKELNRVIDDLLSIVESQDKVFHNLPGFQDFVKFLKDLKNNSCILETANISEIIRLFSSGNVVNGIQLVIKTFVHLGNLPKTLPAVFNHIITLAKTNVQLLLHAGQSFGNISNLAHLTNLTNIQDLLHGINLPDGLSPSAFLSHIPVLGDIFKQITQDLPGQLDIGKIFNSSSIIDNIRNLTGNPIQIFGTIGTEISHAVEQGPGQVIGGIFNQTSNIASQFENAISAGASNLGGIFGGNSESSEASKEDDRHVHKRAKHHHRSKTHQQQ